LKKKLNVFKKINKFTLKNSDAGMWVLDMNFVEQINIVPCYFEYNKDKYSIKIQMVFEKNKFFNIVIDDFSLYKSVNLNVCKTLDYTIYFDYRNNPKNIDTNLDKEMLEYCENIFLNKKTLKIWYKSDWRTLKLIDFDIELIKKEQR